MMVRINAALLTLVVFTTYAAADQPARIQIRGLKADAVLTIGDYKAQQSGTDRSFESPALAEGKTFVYKVKATWTEGGKEKSEERDVEVKAGQTTIVDFSTTGGPKMPVPNPKTRTFEFNYETTVSGLKPGQAARIWLPIPPANANQKIEVVGKLPGKIEKETKFGNQILYIDGKADDNGDIKLAMTFKVTRNEVLGDAANKTVTKEEIEQFLKPDSKVVNSGPKAMALLKGKTLPKDQFELGKLFYEVVNDHVKYGKPNDIPWGHGDSEMVCDTKVGNCTDFHSLFIALARSNKIPAKFEMGFPIPEKRGEGEVGGYHCWAWFKPEGKGWIPVDISEANKVKDTDPKKVAYYFGNLTEDRVVFTTGRDINLVPKQDGPALNLFIYPYVEVDGKEYDKSKVKRKFSYKDVK